MIIHLSGYFAANRQYLGAGSGQETKIERRFTSIIEEAADSQGCRLPSPEKRCGLFVNWKSRFLHGDKPSFMGRGSRLLHHHLSHACQMNRPK